MADEYELKVGDRIKDNDPRLLNGSRVLVVDRIWWPLSGNRDRAKAICHVSGCSSIRQVSILLRRIHTDGKRRKSGFTLLKESGNA